jgi:hypothetical protein
MEFRNSENEKKGSTKRECGSLLGETPNLADSLNRQVGFHASYDTQHADLDKY